MSLPLAHWHESLKFAIQLLVAYSLTAVIGWDREREEHTAGIRTFPIVGMASCGFLLIVAGSPDVATPSRLMQGLITGIGFVGAGAILKRASTSAAPLPPPASGTPVSSASPSQWNAMTSLSF